MDRKELLDKLVELLQQHKDGSRGSIHQEPYKSDFFRLFAAAFNGGLIDSPGQSDYLSADALTDAVGGRSPELLDQESWHTLYRFWSDWTYAWRNANLMTR